MLSDHIKKLISGIESPEIPDELQSWAEDVPVKSMVKLHDEFVPVIGGPVSSDHCVELLQFIQRCEDRGLEETKRILTALAMFSN